MTVLVVAESYFGNTLTITQAIASGLARPLGLDTITVVRPCQAPHELPPDVDLLLVGAPTHEFSLPKAQSRKHAGEKGATAGPLVDGEVQRAEAWGAQLGARSAGSRPG
jgi:hypothetical protein